MKPNRKIVHERVKGAGFLFLIMLAGCSVVTHYPAQMSGPIRDFDAANLESAYKYIEKRYDGELDRLLYYLEGGMILHCEGDLTESNKIFTEADNLIRAQQERAIISLSKGTAQLGSLLLNEKTLPYQGAAFERVLVDTFKAMNYLFGEDYEGARVEIRRSFAVQEENRKRHQKEIQRMEAEASQKGIPSQELLQEVGAYYRDQDSIISRATNPFEDPFAYYLSAIVYELNGEYNDAFIDLKRVEQLRPDVPVVENDLLRMAERSGLWSALRSWKRKLRRSPVSADRNRQAEVLLFFECGMAPRKQQIKINLPIPDVGMVSMAFPKYTPIPSPIRQAAVYDAANHLCGATSMLTDVEAIVFRNLQDRMPILVLKQALRAAAKGAMVKTAKEKGGDLGLLLASAYNVVSEQADLRSWLTLPQNIQVARFPLGAGSHELILALEDGSGHALQKKAFSLDLQAGQTVFLNVRSGTRGLIDFHVY